MDMARYEAILAAYGSDSRRWPDEERSAALAYQAANSQSAKAALAEPKVLDDALATAAHPANDLTFLKAKILREATAADRLPQGANTHTPLPMRAKRAGWRSIAATLILTTGIGFTAGQVAAAQSDLETAETLLSISVPSDYVQEDWQEALQ